MRARDKCKLATLFVLTLLSEEDLSKLWKWLRYMTSPKQDHATRKVLIIHGPRGTGKQRLVTVLEHMLGHAFSVRDELPEAHSPLWLYMSGASCGTAWHELTLTETGDAVVEREPASNAHGHQEVLYEIPNIITSLYSPLSRRNVTLDPTRVICINTPHDGDPSTRSLNRFAYDQLRTAWSGWDSIVDAVLDLVAQRDVVLVTRVNQALQQRRIGGVRAVAIDEKEEKEDAHTNLWRRQHFEAYWDMIRAIVRVRPFALHWQEETAKRLHAEGGREQLALRAEFQDSFDLAA